MISIDWIKVIGGFGLFFFSLRFLSNIFERSITNQFKPLIKKLLSSSPQAIGTGFFTTLLVQASSITIITTMGLLNTSLLTLEQGFMVMLGATLGTTMKTWFFAGAFLSYSSLGILIIGISSISLLLIRQLLLREILEMLVAIGIALMALSMLSQGLAPIKDLPEVQIIFQAYNENSILTHASGILMGILITFALQSSSAVIFLVLGFAAEGLISFTAGTSFILGANIGTTITPLLASIEYGRNVRRLALAHLLIKCCGVLITLFFFPQFVSFVDLVVPGSFQNQALLPIHLAAAHTLFNLINVIFWSFFSSNVVRFMCKLIPSQENFSYDNNYGALPPQVRSMLSGNIVYAIDEANKQMKRLTDIMKGLVDYSLHLLIEGQIKQSNNNSLVYWRNNFETIKESIYELLVQHKFGDLHEEQTQHINHQLRLLRDCSTFFENCMDFANHLEQGILVDEFSFNLSIRQYFELYQQEFNEKWLKIILKNKEGSEAEMLQFVNKIEQEMFWAFRTKDSYQSGQAYWMFDTVRYLKQLTHLLLELNDDSTFFSTKEKSEKKNTPEKKNVSEQDTSDKVAKKESKKADMS